MKAGVALLLVVCAGCGGSAAPQVGKLLSAAQVSRAFATSGLYRAAGLAALFEKSKLATAGGLKTQYWDAHPSSTSHWSVTVEVFPSVRLAQHVVAIGGNIEDESGRPITPFPRVANVVVTVAPSASQSERSRVLRALAALRKSQ